MIRIMMIIIKDNIILLFDMTKGMGEKEEWMTQVKKTLDQRALFELRQEIL